jgi:DNA invertase Pin-like site-specific DNA recombinase
VIRNYSISESGEEGLSMTERTEEVRKKLVEYVSDHPTLTIRAIAAAIGIGYSTLSKVLKEAGYRRRQYRKLASFDLGKLEA